MATKNQVRDFVATGVTSLLAGDMDDYGFDEHNFEYYYENERQFRIYANDELFLVTISKPRPSNKANSADG